MKTPSFHFDSHDLVITISFHEKDDLMIRQIDFQVSYFSAGPGGQHANRHMNGVRLIYVIPHSHFRHSFKTKELMARCIRHRHREGNLRCAFEILFLKLKQYFYVAPVRKKTKKSRSAKERRLKDKRMKALKKELRRDVF